MKNWQERVILEEKELSGKIDSLYSFLCARENKGLECLGILGEQLNAMTYYRDLLVKRINQF